MSILYLKRENKIQKCVDIQFRKSLIIEKCFYPPWEEFPLKGFAWLLLWRIRMVIEVNCSLVGWVFGKEILRWCEGSVKFTAFLVLFLSLQFFSERASMITSLMCRATTVNISSSLNAALQMFFWWSWRFDLPCFSQFNGYLLVVESWVGIA